MRIGYFVQGTVDEAVVEGLRRRWCPEAKLAQRRIRGDSKESLRRELRRALTDLLDRERCDVLVVLTDADDRPWRHVKTQEWQLVPAECQHVTVYGVADRNIECWLAIDRDALAVEIGCLPAEIPRNDPSGFIKRRLGLEARGVSKNEAKERIASFVARIRLKPWIENSDSFEDFHDDVRRLSQQRGCDIPNELEDQLSL